MFLTRWVSCNRFLSDRRRFELYPPFWVMRVKVLEANADLRHIRLKLPLIWSTRNRGGSMFGGSQASLADPIAPIACAKVFPGYSVWTRSLKLDFRQEGTTDLELRFIFPEDQELQIRRELEEKGRSTPTFEYAYYLANGELCTLIHCTVAIRQRGYKKTSPSKDGPNANES